MKKACIVTIVFAIAVFSWMLFLKVNELPTDKAYDATLKRLQRESESSPAFVEYSTLHYDEARISMHELLERIDSRFSFKEVLFIDDRIAYVTYAVYEGRDTLMWCVASIDLLNLHFSELCSLSSPDRPYMLSYHQDYEDACAFFNNSCVVLNDGDTVVEYDLSMQTTTTYSNDSYTFPVKSTSGRFIDSDTLELVIEGSPSHYKLSDLVADSTSLAAIPSITMFRNSIQILGSGDIFVVLQAKNKMGESYAILVSYEQGTWKYIDSYFTGDVASRLCYVVPTTMHDNVDKQD